MSSRDDTTARLAVRVLAWIAAGVGLLTAAETFIELHRTGTPWDSLHASSGQGKALASTVSRAFNNLAAMVLGFVSLAIPLTANMYTPRLVEIFFSDKVNLAGLAFFSAMGAHAVFGQWIMFDAWAPATHIWALWISGVIGFVVLVPYYLYVLDFLNPTTIIERVRDRVTVEYPKVVHATTPEGVRNLQQRLHDRILQLGNVALRAVDRSDRDVAIDAIAAIEEAQTAFGRFKASAPPAFFEVRPALFPGLSAEALALLHREKTWVEHRSMSQLHLAYVAALSKMSDAISAISLVNRRIALHAATSGDDAVLGLAIRYFNTYVRTAVAKKDLHAVYDVFHQYRLLATELLVARPTRSIEIAGHLRYYAGLARFQGMAFVYELAAAEVAALVESAFDAKSPCASAVFDELGKFHSGASSGRLVKADAVLAGYFQEKGLRDERDRVDAFLRAAPRALVEAARRDLAATTDEVFWEVTDRQTNLDFVEPARRARVLRILDEVLEALPATQPHKS